MWKNIEIDYVSFIFLIVMLIDKNNFSLRSNLASQIKHLDIWLEVMQANTKRFSKNAQTPLIDPHNISEFLDFRVDWCNMSVGYLIGLVKWKFIQEIFSFAENYLVLMVATYRIDKLWNPLISLNSSELTTYWIEESLCFKELKF